MAKIGIYQTRTITRLISGTAQTYTLPANVKRLRVTLVGAGGGGGGAGVGTAGTSGGNTIFGPNLAAGGGVLGNTNGGGPGGAGAGAGQGNGESGSAGLIIVEEFYQ